MRESLRDLSGTLRQVPYPTPLPEAVQHLHCYLIDAGHCILAIPRRFEDTAAAQRMRYEVPLPAKYVLEHGWQQMPGTDSIVVDVPYDNNFGAMVPEGYEEW